MQRDVKTWLRDRKWGKVIITEPEQILSFNDVSHITMCKPAWLCSVRRGACSLVPVWNTTQMIDGFLFELEVGHRCRCSFYPDFRWVSCSLFVPSCFDLLSLTLSLRFTSCTENSGVTYYHGEWMLLNSAVACEWCHVICMVDSNSHAQYDIKSLVKCRHVNFSTLVLYTFCWWLSRKGSRIVSTHEHTNILFYMGKSHFDVSL